MKTTLGFEYDIQVIEKVKGGIIISTACENGERQDKINMSMDDYQELTEEKLLEEVEYLNLDQWVNEVETNFITQELNKYCLDNSIADIHVTYSVSLFNGITVTVQKMKAIYNGGIAPEFANIEFNHAYGVEKINELILKLK